MNAVKALVKYALERKLIDECETNWAVNQILQVMETDSLPDIETADDAPLNVILDALSDEAGWRRVLDAGSVTERDLFDTKLMGALTPRPKQVADAFRERYEEAPEKATDWYYAFSKDTNYIRRDRIPLDLRWKTDTEYGELDITVNLSKPEKDPKAIALARTMPANAYPQCLLCAENEGYAGRIDHPARQNHRMIPLKLSGEDWFLQYSPYVYYNEHCICLNRIHRPMIIDRACFEKLLDFITLFPHYFIGSNADLPIVGGSILAHEHFQGGRYVFPMERAKTETPVALKGYEDVQAGIVKWPMSVLRIRCADRERLAGLADRILRAWREYTDEEACIYAHTGGEAHNTITPIARRRGGDYELDLVLRNNLTSEEYPLGIYHPHPELHHIKKENIGLIEVMGLAVLPRRLKEELGALARHLAAGEDYRRDPLCQIHAEWADALKEKYEFSEGNAWGILQKETGHVFGKVLEHAGVYKRNEEGKAAFLRFIEELNK